MKQPWRRRGRQWGIFVAAALVVSSPAVQVRAEGSLDTLLDDPGHTYPNLVPDVDDARIDNYRVVENGVENGLFLKFDTRAQNLGDVPVQLTVDEVEDAANSTVSQCVSWSLPEAHLCRETAPAGGFTWHEAHDHFHFVDFATYQLRRLAPDGRPDYSDAGLLSVSEKVSFCFVDSQRARADARRAQFYMSCLPAVQGITPGWTDIYGYDLEGQNFPIPGLVDGTYALIIDMDYANVIRETNDDDNYVEITIRVSNGLSQVEIVGRRWPAPDDRGTVTSTTTTTTTKKKPKQQGDGVGQS